MKKYFITGLVILLPLAVTIAVMVFIFNFLTEPFAGMVAHILDSYDLLESDHLFFTGHQIQFFISQLLILGFLFGFTILLGVIARYFFVHYLLKGWDYLFQHIPLVRSIYKASQEVINTLFASKKKSFKQVVLVPFPNNETFAIGLVTQDDMSEFAEGLPSGMVTVFVPTSPNPTSGFLMIYRSEDITLLDMKAEDAFKYLISCGVVAPQFNVQNFAEAVDVR